MDIFVVLSGVAALVLSVLIGTFALYLGYAMFTRLTRKFDDEDELKKGNVAVAVLAASFIFSLGFVMKSTIYPLIDTVFRVFSYEGADRSYAVWNSLVFVGQFAVSILASVFLLWFGVLLFNGLTRGLDEFGEIARGNVAVAILVAAVIITLSLFVEEGLSRLVRSMAVTPGIQSTGLRPFG